ncbi:hypothetical protein K458DRAFT_433331 [Lentithecium fluviatile CBS 122367]|uniref:SET domain-containing protein n=1 Tax=Lentithecium fluviatile CBS 122367 TaxID=1168545 RepID=A0A6G1IUL2_9PLEO|nr:hypothetical protein K458DRAFT_433331 [Lentithecium fluviatile CBS 122367]
MPALYEVRPAPGEGLGCFSSAPILAGTLILTEKPLFAVREPRTNAAVIAAFSDLTSNEKDLYLTLHALDPTNANGARVIDIFNSNAWQTGSRTSILPLAARFNHSCIPNASFAWNPRLSRITVHTIVAIPANTQIKLSYELPYQTLDSRREKLSAYGFACSCSACGCDSAASDARRARMVVLNARIRVAARKQIWSAEVPKAALELVRLLKEEGLVGEALGLAYHEAAAGWKRIGRLDFAIRYAKRELDICTLCYGADSPFVDSSREFLGILREERLAKIARKVSVVDALDLAVGEIALDS